jgi:hypothetical protein
MINKLQLLTIATIVGDNIKFMQESKEEKLMSKEEENNKESNESDYNGDYELEE